MPQRVGVVLVHGLGSQARYRSLREFVAHMRVALKRDFPSAQTSVAKDELYREPRITNETSSVPSPAGLPISWDHLFRPVRISCPDPEISFYEAHWSDDDFEFNAYEKLKHNLWLFTTVWNPIFNYFAGKYQPELGLFEVLVKTLRYFSVGICLHVSEMALVPLSYVLRRTQGFSEIGNFIYEYAGDIKRYASMEGLFLNQVKKDVLQARFDETLIKACQENEHVHVVGHGMGSLIAYDGLTRHDVEPSKMSSEFLDSLEASHATALTVDLEVVRSFISVGSPLDKYYFFWPSRRRSDPQPDFELKRGSVASDGWTCEFSTTRKARGLRWLNVVDAVDPVGTELNLYSRQETRTFAEPKNTCVARRWLPSRAHADYLRDPALLAWLVGVIKSPDVDEIEPPPAASAGAIGIRGAWAFFLSLSSAAATLVVGVAVLAFVLGLGSDLYMDAESNTIFQSLGWLNDVIVFVARLVEVNEIADYPAVLARLVIIGLGALVATLPFSLFYYVKSERKRA